MNVTCPKCGHYYLDLTTIGQQCRWCGWSYYQPTFDSDGTAAPKPTQPYNVDEYLRLVSEAQRLAKQVEEQEIRIHQAEQRGAERERERIAKELACEDFWQHSRDISDEWVSHVTLSAELLEKILGCELPDLWSSVPKLQEPK